MRPPARSNTVSSFAGERTPHAPTSRVVRTVPEPVAPARHFRSSGRCVLSGVTKHDSIINAYVGVLSLCRTMEGVAPTVSTRASRRTRAAAVKARSTRASSRNSEHRKSATPMPCATPATTTVTSATTLQSDASHLSRVTSTSNNSSSSSSRTVTRSTTRRRPTTTTRVSLPAHHPRADLSPFKSPSAAILELAEFLYLYLLVFCSRDNAALGDVPSRQSRCVQSACHVRPPRDRRQPAQLRRQ